MAGNDRQRSGTKGAFRGKVRNGKDSRKYTKGKQGKTDEIRRALTHRARLRKNYFKLLEKEGMDVPKKEGDEIDEFQGNAESDKEEDETSEATTQQSEKSEIDLIKEKVQKREALTFQERILLKKNRREQDKNRKMQKTREKIESMKQKDLKRQRQTERIQSTKTRKGQPLMGPRINNLLEKIKQSKNDS
jgi:hypothetical protein